MDEKKETRAAVLAQRDAIPAEKREERSLALCRQLAKDLLEQLPAGAVIAVFSALKSEVDLSTFCTETQLRGFRVAYPCMVRENPPAAAVAAATSANPGAIASRVTTATPSSTSDDNAAATPDSTSYASPATMQFFLLDPALPAPDFLAHPARAYARDSEALEGCTYVAPEEIDAVLVPLVAFDSHNNRLGYGGGNYDCLLSQLRPDALVAGVAFSEQRVERVPLEPHDLPLPHIFVA